MRNQCRSLAKEGECGYKILRRRGIKQMLQGIEFLLIATEAIVHSGFKSKHRAKNFSLENLYFFKQILYCTYKTKKKNIYIYE
jgi:hypothetical protein